MELRAPVGGHAMATVVEAKLDRRTGALATVVVKRGTLRVGDPVVVGTEWCVHHGKRMKTGIKQWRGGNMMGHHCMRRKPCLL